MDHTKQQTFEYISEEDEVKKYEDLEMTGSDYFREVQKNKVAEFKESIDDYCNRLSKMGMTDYDLFHIAVWEEFYHGDFNPFYSEWLNTLWNLFDTEITFEWDGKSETTSFETVVDNLWSGDDYRITAFEEKSYNEIPGKNLGIISVTYDFCPNLNGYHRAMFETSLESEKIDIEIREAVHPLTWELDFDRKSRKYYWF